ncbi:hypothetical protein HPB51_015320 [Rhipicephalus microplus]|uniref:Ubiquitin-conjugating enzyme E2 Z n=1 Tax=Rhipicephalus microplus TaxID=6941 RepID=A0A9J6DH57_RHIMP|nr:hypothetical protein HPB51_015320 [Rhipicephalus microplus]
MASALATRTRPRPPVQFKRDEDVPSVCVSRVKKDVADIARDPPPGIYVAPNENDVTRIDALVVGPSGTPYEGGFLWFHVVCPPEYPMQPPRVTLMTTDAGRVQLHPNIYSSGHVTLSILGTHDGPQWSSAQSLCSVLLSIQSLLSEDPYYNQTYVVKGANRQDANNYKEYVRHEIFRVAVCDAVESCLQQRCPYPAELRTTVLKQFLEFYDRYEESVRSCLHLDGTRIRDPISYVKGTYQHKALLARLEGLKAKVRKRSEPAVPYACK